MRRFPTLYAYAGAAASGLLFAPKALAYSFALPVPGNTNVDPAGNGLTTTIPNLATTVINIILLVAGVLAVLYLILSGIQYITSAGNADKAKAARAGIIHAIIGIIIIMAAFFIVRLAASAGLTASTADNPSASGSSITGTSTGSAFSTSTGQ